MKKTLLPPLACAAVLLVACTRTEAPKTTASNSNDSSQPQPVADASGNTGRSLASTQVADTGTPIAPALTTAAAAKSASPAHATLTPHPTPPAADVALAPVASPLLPASAAAMHDRFQIAVAARIAEWRLKGDAIKAEFDSSGRVVRSKPVGAGEPTGKMDSVIAGSVKEKIDSDFGLAGQRIQAEASDGVVTLNGTAGSLEQIGRAVALSLDTPGVKQVISTIRVESKE